MYVSGCTSIKENYKYNRYLFTVGLNPHNSLLEELLDNPFNSKQLILLGLSIYLFSHNFLVYCFKSRNY